MIIAIMFFMAMRQTRKFPRTYRFISIIIPWRPLNAIAKFSNTAILITCIQATMIIKGRCRAHCRAINRSNTIFSFKVGLVGPFVMIVNSRRRIIKIIVLMRLIHPPASKRNVRTMFYITSITPNITNGATQISVLMKRRKYSKRYRRRAHPINFLTRSFRACIMNLRTNNCIQIMVKVNLCRAVTNRIRFRVLMAFIARVHRLTPSMNLNAQVNQVGNVSLTVKAMKYSVSFRATVMTFMV